jgi:thiol:disulfide interchange protein DsbD
MRGLERLASCGLSCSALLLVMVSMFPASAWAASASGPHLTVDLVAENASITPGRSFETGLKVTLERGWHVYWINPGDSGEPPKIQWKLPAGFEPGAIAWPTPVHLPIASLMDYGYENQVLLMVPIQAPADLKPGTNVPLAATIKWIVCSETCIPGHGDVSLTLPVSSGAAKHSTDQELFTKTRQSLPQPAPESWKQSVLARKDAFVLTIRSGKPVSSAAFFPMDEDEIENAAPQQVHSEPVGVSIELKKSEQLLKPIARLRGVAVLDGKAYEINAPVRNAAK